MITHNKEILLILLFSLYIERNKFLVFCDSWALKWNQHFINDQIDHDIWFIYNSEPGKNY